MNSTEDPSWSQAEQFDHSVAMEELDFGNFLDIGDLDLSTYQPLDHNENIGQHVQQPSDTSYTGDMQGIQGGHSAFDFAADQFEMQPDITTREHLMHGVNRSSNSVPDYGNHISQHQHQHQQLWSGQQQHPHMQQAYQHPSHIPPTPNSYEMHGAAGRFLAQQMDAQTRAFLEQRYQLKTDDFTPLISPAVTPQDPHYQPIPEYTIPGAYFSPLTSPAIVAQNAGHPQQPQGYYTNPSTAHSSLATSPIDLNFDVDMVGDSLSLPEPARKSTRQRKAQLPRSVGPIARSRRSPIVKANKRKSLTLSSTIAPREYESLVREALPKSATVSQSSSITDSTGTGSASPEPLIDSIMGPPPRPRSTLHSPSILAQSQTVPLTTEISMSAAPATPASLMSLENPQQLSGSQTGSQHPHSAHPLAQSSTCESAGIDDFALPPSATPEVDSTPTASTQVTPRLSARKTPKLHPLGTALSPAIPGMMSPMIAGTPGSIRTPSDRSWKNSNGKSRNSISAGSAMASPALRPKISPSIKPLLPEGATLDAMSLASKSNYTHILEGTLLPGVSYPESLSSGLTSKRTSHKIAEQGRRNRINDALKELTILLPFTGSKAEKEEKEEGNGDAKSANSKAATVESAIDYIKLLKREHSEQEAALKHRDDEVAKLRKQLADAQIRLGGRAHADVPDDETETTADMEPTMIDAQ